MTDNHEALLAFDAFVVDFQNKINALMDEMADKMARAEEEPDVIGRQCIMDIEEYVAGKETEFEQKVSSICANS